MENMFSILKISLVVVYEKESLYVFFCILTVSIGEKRRRKRWEELVVKWLWAGYGSASGEIELLRWWLTVGWLSCGWNFHIYFKAIQILGNNRNGLNGKHIWVKNLKIFKAIEGATNWKIVN